jgi:hypothetical protein
MPQDIPINDACLGRYCRIEGAVQILVSIRYKMNDFHYFLLFGSYALILASQAKFDFLFVWFSTQLLILLYLALLKNKRARFLAGSQAMHCPGDSYYILFIHPDMAAESIYYPPLLLFRIAAE